MAGQVGRFGARTVRSQLIAGTAAAVSVCAIATSGVTTTDLHHPSLRVPAVASVELAALANPLLPIFDTLEKVNLYTFSIAEPPTTTFDRAGFIPDFLAAGAPILSQYFLNASDYINKAIQYLIRDYDPVYTQYPGALRLLAWAADALPANIVYAAQQAFSGNLVGALQTVQFAVINPIQAALYQTLNSGVYVLGGVTTRAAAVLTAITDEIPTAIRNLADSATLVLNAAGRVVENVAYGVQTLSPERVWNALVVGLLGTSSDPNTPTIPDALINQTIGEGGKLYVYPGGQYYSQVDSIRQTLITVRDAITDALATDVPVPSNPPFTVSFVFPSGIPTPWSPTPAPVATPLQATASTNTTTSTTTSATTATTERASVAATSANNTSEAAPDSSATAGSATQSTADTVHPTRGADDTGRAKARTARNADGAAQSASAAGDASAKPSAGQARAHSAAR
ncbi:hypothetical protein BayCH28_24105 [Mycolicibacterium sp. CH28]|uniref:hypothetical protein n=1 Tax=Mycolicibacterium sp. CH28 TaxID=2512237 RepID=UPI001081CD33|nr:hypothetical protein [Mycolicibacterium sp. CH28]TGD84511.1 hypothetical protein BayCH28_24105 [Mycolicibacterium sp. CH28]